MRTTNIKFTGLASGLDTEALVKSMITPYKVKVDTAKQNQTMMEWKKEAWKDINSQLFGFYDKYISKMRLESTFNKNKASMSNNTTVQLDKNTNIPTGTHSIKVDNIATGGIVETKPITGDSTKKLTTETTLGSIPVFSGTDSVKIEFGGIPAIPAQPGPPPIPEIPKVEGTIITFNKEDKLANVEKKMQTAMPEWNVKFDEGLGTFFISSKKTGAEQKIRIEGEVGKEIDSGKFFDAIGLVADSTGIVKSMGATDANYTYNGVKLTSSTNDISVNEIKMTLIGVGDIQLVATQDTDEIIDFVKEFVDEYNTLINGLYEKLGASSAKGYKPLTDEQKKDMSDSEIVAWEKKIKDSLLRRDPDLKSALDEMRGILGGAVEGNPFGSLVGIGISTGNWKENGKLYIDETKLREALQKDSKSVADLLAGNGTGEGNKGIADRLYDTITANTKSSTLKSSYSFYNDKVLDKKMQSEAKEIKKLEARMYAMEDMYYKKFTAMEKMMSQLNNQTNSLMSMLG